MGDFRASSTGCWALWKPRHATWPIFNSQTKPLITASSAFDWWWLTALDFISSRLHMWMSSATFAANQSTGRIDEMMIWIDLQTGTRIFMIRFVYISPTLRNKWLHFGRDPDQIWVLNLDPDHFQIMDVTQKQVVRFLRKTCCVSRMWPQKQLLQCLEQSGDDLDPDLGYSNWPGSIIFIYCLTLRQKPSSRTHRGQVRWCQPSVNVCVCVSGLRRSSVSHSWMPPLGVQTESVAKHIPLEPSARRLLLPEEERRGRQDGGGEDEGDWPHLLAEGSLTFSPVPKVIVECLAQPPQALRGPWGHDWPSSLWRQLIGDLQTSAMHTSIPCITLQTINTWWCHNHTATPHDQSWVKEIKNVVGSNPCDTTVLILHPGRQMDG